MKTLIKIALPAILLLGLTACSTSPVVDTHGVDKAQFERDLAECESIVDQMEQGETVARSAAFGAVVGGIFGAISGNVESGLLLGGAGGGAASALSTDQERAQMIRTCLRNRGYNVLN